MTSSTMDRQACYQFKASFVPCTILQLIRYDLDELEQTINHAISRAPNFFIGAPIVIDLEKVKTTRDIQFGQLKKLLIANGLVPVGVRGGSDEQNIEAITHGLPALSVGKLSHTDAPKKKTSEPQIKEERVEVRVEERTAASKLVTSPIRSGMQVYAKDTDLIVVASVSAGAELLADGNIHVYGPLRGRALAGVQGNTQARIFCRTLEAELISIAGYYLTKEDMQKLPENHGMIQIYLENEQVRIGTI